MSTRTLPHAEWADYFGAVTPAGGGPGHADHVILRRRPPNGQGTRETRRFRFQAFTYDPRDDLFEITTPGLRHFVHHPAAVRVDEVQGRLRRVAFVFPNGAAEVVDLGVRRSPRGGHA